MRGERWREVQLEALRLTIQTGRRYIECVYSVLKNQSCVEWANTSIWDREALADFLFDYYEYKAKMKAAGLTVGQ